MIQTRLQNPPVPEFVAVPRRASSGGWTVRRQKDFIAALAASGSVAQAVAAVGMSKTGVYLLRNAPGGDDFRRAWDLAIESGVAVLKSVAFERAVDGIEETICEDGKPVRTVRRYDNRMLVRLLAIYDTPARAEARAAAAAEAEAAKVTRAEIVERFRTLCRRLAAEKAAAEAAAAVAAEAAPFVPPMANRPAPPAAPAGADASERWTQPEPPLPRIWTG